MGNLTVTVVKRNVTGGQRRVIADITYSSSYATNGDTMVAADITKLLPEATGGLADVLLATFEDSSLGHAAYLDRTNKKIKAWNGTTEIANATNLSAVTVRGEFVYGQVTG